MDKMDEKMEHFGINMETIKQNAIKMLEMKI